MPLGAAIWACKVLAGGLHSAVALGQSHLDLIHCCNITLGLAVLAWPWLQVFLNLSSSIRQSMWTVKCYWNAETVIHVWLSSGELALCCHRHKWCLFSLFSLLAALLLHRWVYRFFERGEKYQMVPLCHLSRSEQKQAVAKEWHLRGLA